MSDSPREFFAIQALIGLLLAYGPNGPYNREAIVTESVALADALIAQLKEASHNGHEATR